MRGVLRGAAGARLISGEPAHQALAQSQRVERELADLASVFGKLRLILAHYPTLAAADPQPCYRLA